jgi:chromosome segregation ATPase
MDEEQVTDPAAQAGANAPMDDQPTELETLRGTLEQRETELEANRVAVERLRAALATIEPALTPEMLAGDTVEELEASFTTAMDTLKRLRDEVRREQVLAVGAGVPGRHGRGPLTALEKIREGLARS